MSETTKKQFDELKAKHPDAVLLFRVGDFYECYMEDAKTVSDVLGLTLTRVDSTFHYKEPAYMCGFPNHALDSYLPKLVRAGVRVALCDQLKEPPAKEPTTSQTFNSKRNMEKKKKAEIINIPIGAIQPSPRNPRKTFDEADLKELADNIKQQGLLQPITVRPMLDGCYEIVCGERRYRAWCLLVKDGGQVSVEIPSIVREMTDEQAFDAMITENLQRKDVDPMEEAFAFAQLVGMGKTTDEIALRFGKSKRFIADRIRLDKLIPELKKGVTDGGVNIGAALLLCKLDEDKQREFLDDYEPDPDEPITKDDVEDYTDKLFMRIDRAPWREDFCGSCGCACEKCQFNNANAGCLFYEMKVTKEQASCTNRDKFDAKRLDWLKHLIDEEAEVLVEKGGELETGKTIICTLSTYATDSSEYDSLLEYCDEKGYRHIPVHTMFNRWSSYKEGDERLQEKLDNNEVYRALVIEKNWNGANVYTRYYEVAKGGDSDPNETKAMQLVREHKENISRSKGAIAKEFRNAVKEFNTHEIAWKDFTDAEWEIFLTALINASPYTVKETIMGKERDEAAFVKAHNTPEERDRIMREWLRGKLSDSGVEYYPTLQDCQSALIDEWGIDATEVRARAAEKLAKKQSKIEAELTALGYDTEGKKLAF